MTVSFPKGSYGVRLASGTSDIAACQALRQRAFRGQPGSDADHFDASCTHVMIADPQGLVATCRIMILTGPHQIDRCYAAERYDLKALSRAPYPMMELGRFCTLPDANNADVLRLAWGALAQIVDRAGVGLIFGCASFPGTDPAPYRGAFAWLAARAGAPAHLAPGVKSAATVPLASTEQPDGLRSIPPLLRSYLAMGGWVGDHAVVDHDLNTQHVFTGLEVANIPVRRAAAMRAVTPLSATDRDILMPANAGLC